MGTKLAGHGRDQLFHIFLIAIGDLVHRQFTNHRFAHFERLNGTTFERRRLGRGHAIFVSVAVEHGAVFGQDHLMQIVMVAHLRQILRHEGFPALKRQATIRHFGSLAVALCLCQQAQVVDLLCNLARNRLDKLLVFGRPRAALGRF